MTERYLWNTTPGYPPYRKPARPYPPAAQLPVEPATPAPTSTAQPYYSTPFHVPTEPVTPPVPGPPVPAAPTCAQPAQQPYAAYSQLQQMPPAPPAYSQMPQQYSARPVQLQPLPRKSSVPAVLASISLAASAMLFLAWNATSMTSLSGYDTISASIGSVMALFALCAMFLFVAIVFGVAAVVASSTTRSYMPLSVASLVLAIGPLMSLIFMMIMML